MLFYPIPQSLGCATYVARITLARKFINDGTFLVGMHAILLNGRKGPPRAVNNTRIEKLEKLKTIFLDNGYPEDVILSYTKEKIASFSAVQKFGPQKCPVYLKLPWIGNASLRFESQIRQAITKCFFAVNPRIVHLQNGSNISPSTKCNGNRCRLGQLFVSYSELI